MPMCPPVPRHLKRVMNVKVNPSQVKLSNRNSQQLKHHRGGNHLTVSRQHPVPIKAPFVHCPIGKGGLMRNVALDKSADSCRLNLIMGIFFVTRGNDAPSNLHNTILLQATPPSERSRQIHDML